MYVLTEITVLKSKLSREPRCSDSSSHSLNFVIINTVQYITIAHSLRLLSNRGGPQVRGYSLPRRDTHQ